MTDAIHSGASDRELLAAVGQGSIAALTAIYREHKDRLLTLAFHILGDIGLAEDALQDVFVNFAQRAKQLELRGTLRGFLTTAILNQARDTSRREHRKAKHAAPTFAHEQIAPTETTLADRERTQRIAAVLQQLSPEQREVVVLHVFDDLKLREVAELLAIPKNTAQSRYRYAIANVRSKLQAAGIDR